MGSRIPVKKEMSSKCLAVVLIASVSGSALPSCTATEVAFIGIDRSGAYAGLPNGAWVGHVGHNIVQRGSKKYGPQYIQVDGSTAEAALVKGDRIQLFRTPGFDTCVATALSEKYVVGFGRMDLLFHPFLWSRQGGKGIDLLPVGAKSGQANGAAGEYQVGGINERSNPRAILWHGSPESAKDMTPPNVDGACLFGICEVKPGRYAILGGTTDDAGRALLWPDLTAAPIDLTPPGAKDCQAAALDAESQVGAVNLAPCVWHGSSASYVNLMPPGGSTGVAFAVSGAYQAGYVIFGNVTHAALWRGSANSFFDLNSVLTQRGLTGAVARAVVTDGDKAVVYGTVTRETRVDGVNLTETHAVRWDYTP